MSDSGNPNFAFGRMRVGTEASTLYGSLEPVFKIVLAHTVYQMRHNGMEKAKKPAK